MVLWVSLVRCRTGRPSHGNVLLPAKPDDRGGDALIARLAGHGYSPPSLQAGELGDPRTDHDQGRPPGNFGPGMAQDRLVF